MVVANDSVLGGPLSMVTGPKSSVAVPEMAVSTPEDRKKVRDTILLIRQEIDNHYMRLGALLIQVRDTALYREWGFESFDEYVLEELGFRKRKAEYHMSIWRRFSQLGLGEKDLCKLGWSKAALLAPHVNEKNAGEWIDRASDRTVLQLANDLKTARSGAAPGESGSAFLPADSNEDEIPKTMTFSLFPAQESSIRDALGIASRLADSDKAGHLISMIALEFLSNHAEGSSEFQQVEWWVARIKQRFPSHDVVVFKSEDEGDLREKLQGLIDEL